MPIEKKEAHKWLYSFHSFPKVSFETQHLEEQVYLIVRKHPFTQLHWAFNTVLVLVLGIFLGLAIFPQFLEPGEIFVYLLFIFFLAFTYVWVNLLIWYFTVGIITNERIIDLDLFNIIYKEFTATTILQVSDITTRIGGFFGSILHFGDVQVKTEGFQQNIEFDAIPEPAEVVQIVNELVKEAQTKVNVIQ